jgi:hypothetical protein
VYLNGYTSMGELMVGLAKYVAFYNGERPYQSLGQISRAPVMMTSTITSCQKWQPARPLLRLSQQIYSVRIRSFARGSYDH